MKNNLLYQQLAVILILTAILAHTFGRVFIIADYYTNTNAYAKYCINKARPRMHCNGKCQMMKKMRQQEEKERQDAEKKAEYNIDVLSSGYFLVSVSPNNSQWVSIIYDTTFLFREVKMPRSIFHPPGV